MSWLGLGLIPGGIANAQLGQLTAAAPPFLAPHSNWEGSPGSGFASVPVDPVRTTAKPAMRPLVPPGQRFTDTLRYGVIAFAVNEGSLIDGIETVRFHFEGSVVDVSEPSFQVFNRHDGTPYLVLGYWVNLAKPATTAGTAQLYIEAVPRDPAMQSRVLGPFLFHPATALHDAEYTIDPETSVSSTNFHAFDDAIAQIKSDAPANPRLTFKRAMSNVEMNVAGPSFTPEGYLTVEADAPVTFGRTSLKPGSDVDSASNMRPRFDGIWFRGPNLTFDFAFVNQIVNEGLKDHVFEGVTLTNSRGPTALWRGGVYFTGQRVDEHPWFMECNVSNLDNFAPQASLSRGCTITDISRDVFANTLCVVGTAVMRHNVEHLSNDAPAFTVQYSGSAATATLARSGNVDPANAVYTFAWGASTATFATGKTSQYYAGASGDGYWFDDLVAWINTTLAAQDAGWSATLQLGAQERRASSGSLPGLKAQGFGPTDCKSAPLQVVSSFDAHGDWWQHRFNDLTENIVAYGNVGTDMQAQNIFVASNVDARDFVFVNNAFHNNDAATSDYFDPADASSQLGRPNSATSLSHVVIAHNSLANQSLVFRDDGTNPASFDGYCLIANNISRGLSQAGSTQIDAVVTNNHVHSDINLPGAATGTTSGGDETSLFVDAARGDFTPAGDLLTGTAAPVVAFDLEGSPFAASLAKVGAKTLDEA